MRTKLRRGLAGTAIVAVVALAGCGGGGSSSGSRTAAGVRAFYVEFVADLKAQRFRKICSDDFDATAAAKLSVFGSCAKLLAEALAKHTGKLTAKPLRSVKVTGNRAIAIASNGTKMRLLYVSGRWEVDG